MLERLLHSGSFSPTAGYGYLHPRGEEAEVGKSADLPGFFGNVAGLMGVWASSATEADGGLTLLWKDLRV